MDKRCLTYPNLAKYIQDDEKLDFLHEFVPTKITVRDYKKILAEEKVRSVDDESNSDTSEEESEDESGESADDEEGEEEEEEEEDEKK